MRVLLVDDHPMFRAGVRMLLETDGRAEVVGEAETGEDAVALAARLAPDVVVMDLHLPGLDGVSATRRIVEADPGIGVLVVTMSGEDSAVVESLRAGARGYLLKDSGPEEIVNAVLSVAGGVAAFGPAVARRITELLATAPHPWSATASASPRPPAGGPAPGSPPSPARAVDATAAALVATLTTRERELLALVADGLSNQQLVERFVLSPKTVRNHITNIFAKLGVGTRAEAVVVARRAGLGD